MFTWFRSAIWSVAPLLSCQSQRFGCYQALFLLRAKRGMSLGTRLVLGEMVFASLITRTVKVSEIHEWTLHRQEQNRMCKASKVRDRMYKPGESMKLLRSKTECASQLQYIYFCAECLTRNFISKSVSMQQSPKLNYYYYKQTTKSTFVWTM